MYCPIAQTKEYEIKDIKEENEYCKPFFEGDKFNSSRLKVLVLGIDYDSEKEFKNAIGQHVLKDGFQEIEPFKTYTGMVKMVCFILFMGAMMLRLIGISLEKREESHQV